MPDQTIEAFIPKVQNKEILPGRKKKGEKVDYQLSNISKM